MHYFKKLIDENEVELVSYVKQYLAANQLEDIKIHVGCDSQNIGPLTHYATTVVFHIGNSGCHFIYKKRNFLKLKICGQNFGEKQQDQWRLRTI